MITTNGQIALIDAKVKAEGSVGGNIKNGKTPSGKPSGEAASISSPTNQNGTTSAKVKESQMNITEADKGMARQQKKEQHEQEYRETFKKMYKKYETMRNECSERGNFSKESVTKYTAELQNILKMYLLDSAKQGYAHAQLSDHRVELSDINIECDDVVHAADLSVERFVSDLSTKTNVKDCDIQSVFDFLEYRLRFICVNFYQKAFNYGVVKGYAVQGVKTLQLDLTDEHKDRKSTINTDNFDIDSIPPFSSYCSCSIKKPKQRSKS
jgi:hypothetical protein